VIKRAIDLLGAALGLLLLAPLMLAIALAIKLDSPGPVFFRQERVGRHGRTFRLFKFRTMTAVQPTGGLQITVGADPRITRVGAVLRRWKLDEIPQLIDVLRGTMSLVGPRPEVPRYVAQYPEEKRRRLLSVRPGVTDFASLRYRNESELLAAAADPEREYVDVILPEKLRVAANYVEHASWRSDLRLLGLTLKEVFGPALPTGPVSRLMNHARFWQRIDHLLSTPWRQRTLLAVAFDALLVLGCWHATYLFRLGFERWQPGRAWYDDVVSVGVAAVYLLALQLFGARGSMWRYFGFDDFRRLAWACVVAGLVSATAIQLAQLSKVSRAVLVLHPLFTLLALLLVRMAVRGLWEHAHSVATGDDGQRRYVIVLGANIVARRLIAGLHLRHGWHVLMLLDDDPSLQGMRIAGVPVAGPLERLRDPALTLGATHVVLALGGVPAAQRARALELARESGLTVLRVPEADELEPAPAPAGGAASEIDAGRIHALRRKS
jgi:lipopolysaccharide/colanic/teichoic acid biosynthesis glycosyltransferase